MTRKLLISMIFLGLLSVSRISADPSPEALHKVTSQLLCTCGCSNMLVSNCECSTAAKMRKEAAAMLDAGKSESEILTAFEQEYGTKVLAEPETQGFDLVAWIMPFVGLAMGSLIVTLVFRRLRVPTNHSSEAGDPTPEHPPVSDRFKKQIEEELRS